MNELNKLYKAMLLSWGGIIKDNGRIMFRVANSVDDVPISIDNMDMYLPTSEVLEGNCIGKVFFHPACENIMSKETEVFKVIRKMTQMKLLEAFRNYPIVLIGAAASPKKAWNQSILEMMEPLKSIKRSVLTELKDIFARIPVEVGEDGVDMRFIHFKVTKGGGRSQNSGERVYYKTKPVFPFYNEVVKRLSRSEGDSDNQTIELGGYSVSRASLKLVQHVFKSVIPAVLDPDALEYEATSSIGARLVSYLGCYTLVVDQMNRVQNMFRADFDKASIYPLETQWFENIDELPDIYRQVPVLDYNSHNTQQEEVVVNNMNQNSLVNMMAINSSGGQQPTQVAQAHTMLQQAAIVAGYDTSVPQMQPGDKWVKTDIDQVNSRVIHHATNVAGMPVIYLCTKAGNLLQRSEGGGYPGMMPQMMPGMMPQMMHGMMPQMMPGMMPQMMPGMGNMMLVNGMLVPQMMPGTTATAGNAGGAYGGGGGHTYGSNDGYNQVATY